jgi:hypothetical protein
VRSTVIGRPQGLQHFLQTYTVIDVALLHRPQQCLAFLLLCHGAVPEIVRDRRSLFVDETVEVIDEPVYLLLQLAGIRIRVGVLGLQDAVYQQDERLLLFFDDPGYWDAPDCVTNPPHTTHSGITDP